MLRQAMLGNPLPDPSADPTQIDDRNLSIYCGMYAVSRVDVVESCTSEGMRRFLPQWKAIGVFDMYASQPLIICVPRIGTTPYCPHL